MEIIYPNSQEAPLAGFFSHQNNRVCSEIKQIFPAATGFIEKIFAEADGGGGKCAEKKETENDFQSITSSLARRWQWHVMCRHVLCLLGKNEH